jgi:hypothetical protein
MTPGQREWDILDAEGNVQYRVRADARAARHHGFPSVVITEEATDAWPLQVEPVLQTWLGQIFEDIEKNGPTVELWLELASLRTFALERRIDELHRQMRAGGTVPRSDRDDWVTPTAYGDRTGD